MARVNTRNRGYHNKVIVAPSTSTAPITLFSQRSGKFFTNRGQSAATTITLPPAADYKGRKLDYFSVSQITTFSGDATSAPMVAFNNQAAVLLLTVTSAFIGAQMRVVSDGTAWLMMPRMQSYTSTAAPVLTIG